MIRWLSPTRLTHLCLRLLNLGAMIGLTVASHYRVIEDTGRFITSMFIVSGFAHAEVITMSAMIMSVCGGLLVYGSIITYLYIFANREEF
ncbi:Vacuolar protein sorting-associated protein 55 [Dimargaris xerosporica]|nr:Vacuolar protein sorting-associated protein 55 [Dimargaris xerosporica]